jgi:hypothetical protein
VLRTCRISTADPSRSTTGLPSGMLLDMP